MKVSFNSKENLPAAYPGFARRSGGNPKRGTPTYCLAKICKKLDDNEENWTEREDARPKFHYGDPPLFTP